MLQSGTELRASIPASSANRLSAGTKVCARFRNSGATFEVSSVLLLGVDPAAVTFYPRAIFSVADQSQSVSATSEGLSTLDRYGLTAATASNCGAESRAGISTPPEWLGSGSQEYRFTVDRSVGNYRLCLALQVCLVLYWIFFFLPENMNQCVHTTSTLVSVNVTFVLSCVHSGGSFLVSVPSHLLLLGFTLVCLSVAVE